MNHNFKIVNTDTDSIMFCKQDGSAFSKEEQESLLVEINAILPSKIQMTHDGYYSRVCILKAKNYILYDGNKIKLKGSSLKSATLEPALKSFLNEIIDAIVFNRDNYVEIYNKYILEASNITNIKRWASKKTISEKTLVSERANETKIMDAIKDSEYVEGDKVFLYFNEQDELRLIENFDGLYNKDKMYEKLFKATQRFATVLDVKSMFPNYKLKKNKEALEVLLNSGIVV